jgi:raffinose/stachyose/melibiose transport system permease protein
MGLRVGLTRYTWRTLPREAVVVLVGIAFCVPLYLLITISLKTTSDAYIRPLSFPSDPNWNSYSEAAKGNGAGTGMTGAIVHSAIITIGSVICLIVIGSLAAYAIARRQSRLSTLLYIVFLLGIIIPWELGLVPLYIAMRKLDLVGNYLGMIVFYTGLFMPLTVFLYAGFLRVLPRDYEEAAQVDGASQRRIFLRVVMPLLLPVTGTIAVLDALFVWNHFFTQLIFLSGTDKTTVPVAVYALANANIAEWNVIFAAVAIAIAPILAFFLFAQRTMIRGFSGGIRG